MGNICKQINYDITLFNQKKKNMRKPYPRCDACKQKVCAEGKDCFSLSNHTLAKYNDDNIELARAAAKIEGRYYMEKTRLEEVILFSKEMNYKKLGIAFCIGLSEEAKILGKILKKEFEIVSVCCKICGIDKDILNLEKIVSQKAEVMCNPLAQAYFLNQARTDLNLICGLCIGHDILFTQNSQAPVSTYIVKDRVLAHNPAAFLYCRYQRKRLSNEE